MRVLGLDPGALRLGWAIVETDGDGYDLIASGIKGLARGEDQEFAEYRRSLIPYWVEHFDELLYGNFVNRIASELVPAVGSGNFIAATQSELAKTAITVCQTMNHHVYDLPWVELGSSTVKKAVFGAATKPPKPGSKKRVKVSKVDIRNAVQAVFPQLRDRQWDVDLFADETDAVAVALTECGFKARKATRG